MRAQMTFTSAESKKLIGKAVARMEVFQKAMKDGIITIHPSTTTSFIMEEINGAVLDRAFVCGIVTPLGMCIESRDLRYHLERGEKVGASPDKYEPWVLEGGEPRRGVKLIDVLNRMGPDDVYVKTGNALDKRGKVGVLISSTLGGTIGRAFAIAITRGINLVLPIGLEKLISASIEEAAREAGQQRMDYSMGLAVGLLPIIGTVVTELEAIEILTGAKATHISSGGVCGAEGAVTLVVKGSQEQVSTATKLVRAIKGAKVPPLTPSYLDVSCSRCTMSTCPFRGSRHPFSYLFPRRANQGVHQNG